MGFLVATLTRRESLGMRKRKSGGLSGYYSILFYLKSVFRYFLLLVFLVLIYGITFSRACCPSSVEFLNIEWQFSGKYKESMTLVRHDPQGVLFNHDYYAAASDPFIAELIDLVDRGHVEKILPNLRKALRAPDNIKKGYYEQALREVEYTLERLVNHPKALMFVAIIANGLNQPNLPIKYYERALALYPQHAITHAQFGNFLIGIDQRKKGISELEKAIKINPRLSAGYFWLSNAYQKEGQLELAREFAAKARELGYEER